MLGKRKTRLALASLAVTAAAGVVFAFSLGHQPSFQPKAAAPVDVLIDGKVAKLLVNEGDVVQPGQPLAELETISYEADLKKAEDELLQIQGQAQNAIKPMEAVPGISGFLPASLPQPEYVKVPVPVTGKPQPKAEAPQAEKQKAAPAVSAFDAASEGQRRAEKAVDEKTQELARSTAAVAEAQKSRDALRPKITQAEADAVQAEKKAGEAPELLAAGVISQKRSIDLLAEKETTKKALDALKTQVEEAERALADAQAKQKAAHDALLKASADLKTADELLAKANVEPAKPEPAPVKTVPQPRPQPQKMETRIVMRKKPMVVRQEEAPAIPLKVFVDEKTMQTSEQRIAELTKQIEALKQRIAQNKVLAPAAGRVHITASGAIQIVP